MHMKKPWDRFDCSEELGKRLRQCRLKAGLTQQKLATAMGRQGKGSHHLAGRLERGKVPNPGVGVLADYLRACRADFSEVLDVLNRYTARPTVIEVETRRAVEKVSRFLPGKTEQAVTKYDHKVSRSIEARDEPVPDRTERVKRARSYGLSQVWARRVRVEVVGIIVTKKLMPGFEREQHLQNYGAKVWRILNKTRKRHPERREAMLEEAIRPYLCEAGPKPEHLAAVREGLLRFFHEAELTKELDVPPEPEAGEGRPGRGFQPGPNKSLQCQAWDEARNELVEQLWQKVCRMPELSGVPEQRLPLWRSVVRQICAIVDHDAPESDECKRQVEALATNEHFSRQGRDPALVRRLAAVVIPRWEELRSTLGPHPLGRVRPPK
jgi:transcriptional regulator with XRE-family HTH domain